MKQNALLETLETVLVVTVITALIWLYAEGETILTKNRKIEIRFVTPTPGLAITVPGEPSPSLNTTSVSATIQASSGDWARISEWARNQVVEIEVNAPPPGQTQDEQSINLLDALNGSPLAEVRAFVTEVAPATKTVRVQTLETVDMGLRAEPGELRLSTLPDEVPTFIPDRVSVQLPSVDAALVRSQNLKLIGHLDRLDPDALAEDTQKTATVELSLPAELQNKLHVTLEQDTADVTFILDRINKELVLDRVQVRLNISDDMTDRYDFDIEPGTQRFIPVTLKGPEAIIDRIENRIAQDPDLIRASITIKYSDLQEDEELYSAPLNIDVPEGVEIVSPTPSQTFITYTVKDLTEQN